MKMRLKKTRAQKLLAAFNDLERALKMEEPHIRIRLPYGVYDNDEGKKFICAAKEFVRAYKQYYGLKKVELEFVL